MRLAIQLTAAECAQLTFSLPEGQQASHKVLRHLSRLSWCVHTS